MTIRYVPVSLKMVLQSTFVGVVSFWQQCLEEGFMSGILEEKLVNSEIGFTVEECKLIGLREAVANGWRCFYENDMM